MLDIFKKRKMKLWQAVLTYILGFIFFGIFLF